MSVNHWLIGSDNAVFVHHLRDTVTGQYLADATITGVLTDPRGDPVDSASHIVFSHRPGSSGDYVGNIPAAANLQPNQAYTLTLTAVAGGYTKVWRITRTARHDGPSL